MMTNEKDKTVKMDMLHGPLLGKIILFALPLAAGSMLQQLFNAVDIAVVGRFSTSQALAAVGSNSPVITLILNLFVGISVGANVVIANLIGQGKRERISDAVHTAITVALISGIFLLLLGQVIAKPLLIMMSTPDDVLDLAVLYLRLYCLGMPFIMLYNFGASILRSIGDTRRPMYCLIISGVLNAILNLIFVIFFHMSVSGVAIATVISNITSSMMVLRLLIKEKGEVHFSFKNLHVDGKCLKQMLRIGVPAGIQGMVFSFSNVLIQSAINGFGSDVVAGSAVAVNFEYICYFMINGFNQAATTFIGQNYGAGEMTRCKKVWRICFICGIAFCACLNVSFFFLRGSLVTLFTTDATVAEYAFIRMRNVLLLQCLAATYEITGASLRAYGYSMTPSVLMIFGTCVLRVLWVYTVLVRYHSYTVLLGVYPFTWIATGSLLIVSYLILLKRIQKKLLQ
jgi:putative MATE family efflux protein